MFASEEKGISKPPLSFLREIRRQSNRHFKTIVSHKKRDSTFFSSRRIRGSRGSIQKKIELETTEQGLGKI